MRGIWEKINAKLSQKWKVKTERKKKPTGAIVDSQSARTIEKGVLKRGYDEGKKIKERKRHILVETQRLLLQAKVGSIRIDGQK